MHARLNVILATLLTSSTLMVSATEQQPTEAPDSPVQAEAPAMPMQHSGMAEQMKKMQAAHDKAAAAKTPAERMTAMQESMATMRESMGMMQQHCNGTGMGMASDKDNAERGMINMMMKMMDQQSTMMSQPLTK